jgi:hypothetical protein
MKSYALAVLLVRYIDVPLFRGASFVYTGGKDLLTYLAALWCGFDTAVTSDADSNTTSAWKIYMAMMGDERELSTIQTL